MTNREIGERIKQMREARNLSQAALADKVGVKPASISAYENGTRKPSDRALESIARYFGIHAAELKYGEEYGTKVFHSNAISAIRARVEELPGLETYDYKPSQMMIPVVGRVRCGVGGLAYEDLQGSAMADVGNPSEYFYLRAEGDSMAPKITDGDLVLIHRQEEVENGELAVVIIDGEEGTLKKFQRKNGAVILQSLNPNYPPRVFIGEEMKNVYIAGKAVELKRSL